MTVKSFILYRRKLGILYSLLLELPPHLRGRAEEIVDRWRRGEIGFEQALNQVLELEEMSDEILD